MSVANFGDQSLPYSNLNLQLCPMWEFMKRVCKRGEKQGEMEDHTTNLKEIQYFKLWKCSICVTSLIFLTTYIRILSSFGFLIKLELYQNVLILNLPFYMFFCCCRYRHGRRRSLKYDGHKKAFFGLFCT